MRVSDYKILRYDDAADLSNAVRRLLGEGWEPLGGVCVTLGHEAIYRYNQALVKREEPTPPPVPAGNDSDDEVPW